MCEFQSPHIKKMATSEHSNIIAQTLHLNTTSCQTHVQEVADKTEKILRVLTYTLLEAMMNEEEAEGDLVLSSIPLSIIHELRMTKVHFFSTDLTEGNDLDRYVLRSVVEGLQKQLKDTAKHYHKLFHQLVGELDIRYEE